MRKIQILLIILALSLCSANVFANIINDNYVGSNAHGYGDVIGEASQFGIDRMEVNFNSGVMNVEIYTPFTERIAGYGTLYGDLFISTNGWSPKGESPYTSDNYGNGEDWEFVFDTSKGQLYGSGFSVILAENAPPSSTGNYIVRDGQEVLRNAGGTQITDNSSFSDSAAGTYLSYAIEMSSLGLITGDIGLKWGMTCANDTIEGSVPAPVPEPSTMLLLGSGLVGLALYRRRK